MMIDNAGQRFQNFILKNFISCRLHACVNYNEIATAPIPNPWEACRRMRSNLSRGRELVIEMDERKKEGKRLKDNSALKLNAPAVTLQRLVSLSSLAS